MALNLDELKAEADEGVAFCLREIRLWKWLYYGGRSALIVFAGLTSAQALMSLPFLNFTQPFFALLVTLITAFDVWLKPGAKYRALYVANDEYVRVHLKASLVESTDPASDQTVARLLEEFHGVNTRLQAALLP